MQYTNTLCKARSSGCGEKDMTRKEYEIYHGRVLAKTDATNIHRVNGLLGTVLICIVLRKYSGTDKTEVDHAMQITVNEIKRLTGVTP